MTAALLALFRRDLLLATRSGGASLTGALFFLVLCGMIPFAIGPDQKLLSRLAPAILWIGVLLASLLGLDRLFHADEEDGTLDLLMASAAPLAAVVMIKCLAHWLTTGLPLILIVPLLAILLGLDWHFLPRLLLTLCIGTPALTCLGSIGAALTLSLRRGGLVLAVIILPLALPLLIFAVAAASADGADNGARAPLLLLAALALVILAFAPLASAAALRLTRH